MQDNSEGCSPVCELHLELWQVLVQCLNTQLVLVLKGLVQLAIPMGAPRLLVSKTLLFQLVHDGAHLL